jgi:hypothetical protein
MAPDVASFEFHFLGGSAGGLADLARGYPPGIVVPVPCPLLILCLCPLNVLLLSSGNAPGKDPGKVPGAEFLLNVEPLVTDPGIGTPDGLSGRGIDDGACGCGG